ncbi:hypothetical protein F4779DRAFT_291868 [Xylariaceae sp. FL0662B]|nr:hypothetical protein F4779DRAFT_291868 [Xylariaceae sp. FL0662B]
MGLSSRIRVAASACLLALSTSVSAQAFYYEDLSLSCKAENNIQYLGCYSSSSNPFPFAPQAFKQDGDNSNAYIRFDKGDQVNNTVTPYLCSNFCRAEGFKFSGLWNQQCSCGSSLSYKRSDGTQVTLTKQADDTTCKNTADPCPGDRRESCGTNAGAHIYVDPSFPVADQGSLVSGYGLLGCFQGPNLPSGDAGITSPSTPFTSTSQCFTYCAGLGLPYAYMSGSGSSIQCFCGQGFGINSRNLAVNSSDTTCYNSCANPGTACTGQDCCGAGNGPFPVYANPQLMGCFIPRIPGSYDNPPATLVSTGYANCFATPSSVANRATAPLAVAAGATISRSATFVATASPAATPYILYGCYSQNSITDLFAASSDGGVAAASLSVDSCVSACGTGNYAYAAVVANGSPKCYCSNSDPNAGATFQNVQDCNYPCPGSESQNCGGSNPLVYAVSSKAANGPWQKAFSSTYVPTPTYSCSNKASSSSGGASSTTTATTTSGASSTTAAASSSSSSATSGASTATSSRASSSSSSSAASSTTSASASASASTSASSTGGSSAGSSSAGASSASPTSSSAAGSPSSSSTAAGSSSSSSTVAGSSSSSSSRPGSSSSTGAASSSAASSSSSAASSTTPAGSSSSSAAGSSTSSSAGPSSTSAAGSSTSSSARSSTTSAAGSSAAGSSAAGSSAASSAASSSTASGTSTPTAAGSSSSSSFLSSTVSSTVPSASSSASASSSPTTASARTGASSSTTTIRLSQASSSSSAASTESASSTGSTTPASSGSSSITASGSSTIPASSGSARSSILSGSSGSATSAKNSGSASSSLSITSSTTTTSSVSNTSSTSTPTPTVVLASTDVQPFSEIFNTASVPQDRGILVQLQIVDPVTGQATTIEMVVEYVGCFQLAVGQTPFSDNGTDRFRGNADAGGSAASCAGYCSGAQFQLSANNNGDCFCGSEVDLSKLPAAPDRNACNIPCPKDPSQICGGGSPIMKRDPYSFLNIILAQPANQAVLLTVDGNTTMTVGKLPSELTISYP